MAISQPVLEDIIQRERQHLSRHRDALGYIDAYNQGLPLGSGKIESAHRYIPQKRLKLPGTQWSPTTVQLMLALRVLRAPTMRAGGGTTSGDNVSLQPQRPHELPTGLDHTR